MIEPIAPTSKWCENIVVPPVSVQVIAPVLTNFFHCMHCERIFDQAGIGQQMHQEELDQYPEDVKQEASRLADWLFDLAQGRAERLALRRRKAVLRTDDWLDEYLGFAGSER